MDVYKVRKNALANPFHDPLAIYCVGSDERRNVVKKKSLKHK